LPETGAQPLNRGAPSVFEIEVEAGVVGTAGGMERFQRWCMRLQRYITPQDPEDEQFYLSHPPFPGFQAAFRTSWATEPVVRLAIDDQELQSVFIGNVHERVFRTVKVYIQIILGTVGSVHILTLSAARGIALLSVLAVGLNAP
jgi:hypothetical protein